LNQPDGQHADGVVCKDVWRESQCQVVGSLPEVEMLAFQLGQLVDMTNHLDLRRTQITLTHIT
jgi:hypothetical protein